MARTSPEQDHQDELDEIIRNAERSHPGVFDVVQVYGDSEKALSEFRQYLAAIQPQPSPTTSNQSQPLPVTRG